MPGPVGSTGLSDYRLRLVEWPRSPLESRLPPACPRDGCGWRSADSCCLPRCCWRCGRDRSPVSFRGMRWPHHSPRNEELGRVVLSAQNSDDGHEQTFGNADGGGCVVGMFGCKIEDLSRMSDTEIRPFFYECSRSRSIS